MSFNTIYGVRWNIYSDAGEPVLQFVKTYTNEMSIQQINEVYNEYLKLSKSEKERAFFRFYTSSNKTYYCNNFDHLMMWFSTDQHRMEAFLNNSKIISYKQTLPKMLVACSL